MAQRDLLLSRYSTLFWRLSWLMKAFHGTYYCYRGNMDISEIAHVVKHHRKVAKLSQAELARLAGIGKTAVFDLESQERDDSLRCGPKDSRSSEYYRKTWKPTIFDG